VTAAKGRNNGKLKKPQLSSWQLAFPKLQPSPGSLSDYQFLNMLKRQEIFS
jgi:hypothetical protein